VAISATLPLEAICPTAYSQF